MTDDDVTKAHQDSDAANRVAAFLKDDAVKGAFLALEKRYIREFKDSTTPVEREAVHARMTALDNLFTSVLGLVESGKVAQRALEVHARTQDARQRTGRR